MFIILTNHQAFHCAYHLLNQGHNPFSPEDARFLGQVGFRRDTQTYVSLTDPGYVILIRSNDECTLNVFLQ